MEKQNTISGIGKSGEKGVVDLIRRSIITLLDHFLLGPHLQIHTCWLAPCCLESSRRIVAPLYLPCVAAAVNTVWSVPATKGV